MRTFVSMLKVCGAATVLLAAPGAIFAQTAAGNHWSISDASPASAYGASYSLSDDLADDGFGERSAADDDASYADNSDSNCCLECCETAPLWRASAGAIYLHREAPEVQTLIVDGVLAPQFNAAGFNFGYELGWDVSVARQLNCLWEAEARYFDVGDWSDADSVSTLNGNGIAYDNSTDPLGVFSPPTTTAIDYRSSLTNLEFNLRRHTLGDVTLIAGLRYLNIDEQLTGNSVGAGVFTNQQIYTCNDLFGAQLGADFIVIQEGNFQVNAIGKVGVARNSASNHIAAQAPFAAIDVASGVEDVQASLIGDLAFNATYQLTRRWSAQGGFQLLWVDNLALASQQPNANNQPNAGPTTNIDSGSDLLYFGFTGGLQMVY